MHFFKFGNSKSKKIENPVEEKALALNDPNIVDFFGGHSTKSKTVVTTNTAISIPSVFHAVRLISETIGSLPCKLYRNGPDGKEEAKDHPAYKLVHRRPNEWTGANIFRTEITAQALLYGGGFAKVVRFEDGRPFELHSIKQDRVTVLEDQATGAPAYRLSEETGMRDEHFTNVLHIPSFLNKSPINFGKEAIGLASVLEKHGAEFFSDGARPSVIFLNKEAQGGEAGAKSLRQIAASYQKWKEGRGPLLLDKGWLTQFPTMTSTDAQYIENRNFQIIEIARIFGVPPHLLFELERATWSNAETMGAEFLRFCLRPWLDRWSEALATVLLTEEEQDSYYFEFVTDDLLRADAETRTKNITAQVASRILTPNEARAKLNLPPIKGGDELANPYTTTTITAPANTPERDR